MIRLLVADDHPVVRSGLRNLLRNENGIRVAAEARCAAEVLTEAAQRELDAIVLDLALPDTNGLELLPTLRKRFPDVPVIVFTNATNAVDQCLAAGAAAFVSKDSGLEELKAAIEAALDGRVFVDPRSARGWQGASEAPAGDLPHLRLSPRELEVMMQLVQGKRNKEIAFALCISEKTIATHRAKIMEKVGVQDLRGLLLYALRHGLTDWS